MLWLPYERCELVSSLPMAQAVDTLQRATAAWKFTLWGGQPETFLGRVDAYGFELRRNIRYRNSFLPQVRGEFEAAGAKTLIKLRLRLHPVVLIFMCIWMSGVGMALISTAYASIKLHRWNPVLWVPCAMFLFGYLLTMGGFLYERGRTLDALKQVLSAERIEPAMGERF